LDILHGPGITATLEGVIRRVGGEVPLTTMETWCGLVALRRHQKLSTSAPHRRRSRIHLCRDRRWRLGQREFPGQRWRSTPSLSQPQPRSGPGEILVLVTRSVEDVVPSFQVSAVGSTSGTCRDAQGLGGRIHGGEVHFQRSLTILTPGRYDSRMRTLGDAAAARTPGVGGVDGGVQGCSSL